MSRCFVFVYLLSWLFWDSFEARIRLRSSRLIHHILVLVDGTHGGCLGLLVWFHKIVKHEVHVLAVLLLEVPRRMEARAYAHCDLRLLVLHMNWNWKLLIHGVILRVY